MKQFLNYISYFSVLIAFFVTILLLYWQFYPYKVLVFNNEKFPMIQTQVHAGDMLTYEADYCKYMDLPATVTRHIINGFDYTMPSTITDRTMGCHVINVSFILPKETPTGKGYRAEVIYKYEINPLRTIIIKHSTVDFEVLESTLSAERR
jgi:hypothetical protein